MEIIDLHEQPDYWEKVGMRREDFIDRSYVIGGTTIILGIYKTKERKRASFFHELGHIINESGSEELAWETGMKLAKSLGITFSRATRRWIEKQLTSYSSGGIAYREKV